MGGCMESVWYFEEHLLVQIGDASLYDALQLFLEVHQAVGIDVASMHSYRQVVSLQYSKFIFLILYLIPVLG